MASAFGSDGLLTGFLTLSPLSIVPTALGMPATSFRPAEEEDEGSAAVFLPEPFCGGGFLGLPVPDARLSRLSSRRRLSGGPDRFLNTGCGFHQVADVVVSIDIPLPGHLCKHSPVFLSFAAWGVNRPWFKTEKLSSLGLWLMGWWCDWLVRVWGHCGRGETYRLPIALSPVRKVIRKRYFYIRRGLLGRIERLFQHQ